MKQDPASELLLRGAINPVSLLKAQEHQGLTQAAALTLVHTLHLALQLKQQELPSSLSQSCFRLLKHCLNQAMALLPCPTQPLHTVTVNASALAY